MTISNSLLHTITIIYLETEITVSWDGTSCQVNEQVLQMNDRLVITIGEAQLTLYLLNHGDDTISTLDTTDQLNLTFGKEKYDDIAINDKIGRASCRGRE